MMSGHEAILIRDAQPDDAQTITDLIHELAEYEQLAHACKATADAIRTHLFKEPRRAHAIVAQQNDAIVGFALYFYNFSTFLAKPGIYIEDAYVKPASRSQGIGRRMFSHLAAKAVREGCGRLEWWVLDWNQPAIDFYRALGATAMDEWTVQRLEGEALEALAFKEFGA